jgi:crotonobetainyl-CoA:carnitine CoA-transferase CaiB-like acyl-CoA transferase
VTDIMGGSFGAIGIIAALYRRQNTGTGEFVKASLYESVAFLVSQHIGVAAVTGEAPPPMPERGRAWSVYDLFTTADDEQVFIGITSDRHWQRMCDTFGYEDWSADESLATNHGRIEARDWFLPELQNRYGSLTKAELMSLAKQAGIPFAPVNQPLDLVTDQHMVESGSLDDVRIPGGAIAKLPKIPLQLGGKPFALRHQPPRIGEGSQELYRELGYSNDEIEDLYVAGVIQIGEKDRNEGVIVKGVG